MAAGVPYILIVFHPNGVIVEHAEIIALGGGPRRVSVSPSVTACDSAEKHGGSAKFLALANGDIIK